MSNKEINALDPEDIGLKEVMGNRFQDGTKKPMVEPFKAESTNTTQSKKKALKVDKAVDAQWAPIKEHCWMDDLKECVKTSLLFGGLNLLIWYWEVAGLMDESIALPSMLVCAAMFGIGLGKCCRRGNC
jgi:hypothetical protein